MFILFTSSREIKHEYSGCCLGRHLLSGVTFVITTPCLLYGWLSFHSLLLSLQIPLLDFYYFGQIIVRIGNFRDLNLNRLTCKVASTLPIRYKRRTILNLAGHVLFAENVIERAVWPWRLQIQYICLSIQTVQRICFHFYTYVWESSKLFLPTHIYIYIWASGFRRVCGMCHFAHDSSWSLIDEGRFKSLF